MAGTVDIVLRCLTGMRALGPTLRFDPALPPEVKQLRFSVHYRGQRVDVELAEDRIRLSVRPGGTTPVNLLVHGQAVELAPGQERELLLERRVVTAGTATVEQAARAAGGTGAGGRPVPGLRRHAQPRRGRSAGGPAAAGRRGAARTAGPPVRRRRHHLGAARPVPGRARRRTRRPLPRAVRAAGDVRGRGPSGSAAGGGATDGRAAATEALRDSPAVRESGAWLEDKVYAVAVHTRRVARSGAVDRRGRPDRPRGRRPSTDWRSSRERWSGSCGRRCPVTRGTPSAGSWPSPAPGPSWSSVTTSVTCPRSPPSAQLASEGHDGLRVAVRSAEAPPELLASADLVLDGPRRRARPPSPARGLTARRVRLRARRGAGRGRRRTAAPRDHVRSGRRSAARTG